MIWPPHASISIYRSGTPVSVISMTSRRQQQAWQLVQVFCIAGRAEVPMAIISMVMRLEAVAAADCSGAAAAPDCTWSGRACPADHGDECSALVFGVIGGYPGRHVAG